MQGHSLLTLWWMVSALFSIKSSGFRQSEILNNLILVSVDSNKFYYVAYWSLPLILMSEIVSGNWMEQV